MALIKCSECGEKISDKAKSCPKCGCPNIERNTMLRTISNSIKTVIIRKKKTIIKSLIIAAILAFCLWRAYVFFNPKRGFYVYNSKYTSYSKYAYCNTLTAPMPISSEEGKNGTDNVLVCTIHIDSTKKKDSKGNLRVKVFLDKNANNNGFKNNEIFAYITKSEKDDNYHYEKSTKNGLILEANSPYGDTGGTLSLDESILGTIKPTSKVDDDSEVSDSAEYEVRFWVDESVVTVGENGTYTLDEIEKKTINVHFEFELVDDKGNVLDDLFERVE